MLLTTNGRLLHEIRHNQEKIMAGIDDLKQAVQDVATEQAAIAASVANATTKIEAAITEIGTLKASGVLSDADAETLSQQLEGAVTGLKTAGGALDAEATKLAGA
jgi:uncharacterized protein YoxC